MRGFVDGTVGDGHRQMRLAPAVILQPADYWISILVDQGGVAFVFATGQKWREPLPRGSLSVTEHGSSGLRRPCPRPVLRLLDSWTFRPTSGLLLLCYFGSNLTFA